MAGHTLNDVAARAGVSKATASRVLNGNVSVAPETRDRVLTAMAELDYTPSASARRLSFGRTLTISVVTTFLTRPQAAERLRGVDAVLSDSEFDLVIYNVESIDKRDQYLRALAVAQRTDGLLVISLPLRDVDTERLASAAIPVVVIDAHAPAVEGLPHVVGDDIGGGRLRPAISWSSVTGVSRSWAMSSTTHSVSPPAATATSATSVRWRCPAWRSSRSSSRSVPTAATRHGSWPVGSSHWTDDPPLSSPRATPRRSGSSAPPMKPDCACRMTSRSWAMTTSRSRNTWVSPPCVSSCSSQVGSARSCSIREIGSRSPVPPSIVLPPKVVVRGTTAPTKEGRTTH